MKLNFINKIKDFLKEVKAEMKKVTWPSKRDVGGTTLVTIIATLLLAFYLYIADILFTFMIRIIYKLGV